MCSFLMLWANANRMSSVFTFTVPRHRNRRNPLSGFRSPNEPSAWMLRFIRSSQPTSLMIRFRSSFRYSTNYLDTYSALLRSFSGFLLRFLLIHSFYVDIHRIPGNCIPGFPAHIPFCSVPFGIAELQFLPICACVGVRFFMIYHIFNPAYVLLVLPRF